jgi:hypothetical protein
MVIKISDVQYNNPLPTETGGTAYTNSNVLKDPKFLQDLRDYYASKGASVTLLRDDELIDKFYSDQTWSDFNFISAGRDALEAASANEEEKARLNRLRGAWTSLPMFFQEGGRGFWAAAGDATGAILADPTNLIPVAGAYAKGANAARVAAAQGKNALRAGITQGAKTGAKGEAVISGLQEGLLNTASQARDVQLGLQDNFSAGQLAGSTALGATLGAGVGGVLGGVAGGVASRTGAQQATDLARVGYSPDEISGMSNQQAKELIPDEMPAGVITPPPSVQEAATPEEQLSALEVSLTDDEARLQEILADIDEEIKTKQSQPETTPQTLEELKARQDEARRLLSMPARIRKHAEIIKLGENNDVSAVEKHAAVVSQFNKDLNAFRRIIAIVERGEDPEEARLLIDEILALPAPARGVDAGEQSPPPSSASDTEGASDGTARPSDAPSSEKIEEDAESLLDEAELREAFATGGELDDVPFANEDQASRVRKILADAGLSEKDMARDIDDGRLSVGARGKVTNLTIRDLKKLIRSRRQAEAGDAAEAVVDDTTEAVVSETPQGTTRGQEIFAGDDPTVYNDLARVMEEFGETGDLPTDKLRKAIDAHVRGNEDITSSPEDVVDLFDFIDEASRKLKAETPFTKTEMSRIRAKAASIRKSTPALDAETALEMAKVAELKTRGMPSKSPTRGTGDAIERAQGYSRDIRGKSNTGKIQSFLRRNMPISKGSDYTTFAKDRVSRGSFGREEAAARADQQYNPEAPSKEDRIQQVLQRLRGVEPETTSEEDLLKRAEEIVEKNTVDKSGIVEYVTTGREIIYTSDGRKTEVGTGTTAFFDVVTRQAYDSKEYALKARPDNHSRKTIEADEVGGLMPATKKSDVLALFDQFGNDPEAFVKALQARNRGEDVSAPTAPDIPLERGTKLLIIRSKNDPKIVRMISPKQAKNGGDVHTLIGKSGTPDDWEIRYAPRENFTVLKRELREIFDTLPEGEGTDGILPEAGFATGIGRAMTQTEAGEVKVDMNKLTDEELEAISTAYGGIDPEKLVKLEVTLDRIHFAIRQLEITKWKDHISDHMVVANKIALLNRLVEKLAPMGIELPNVARAESVVSLQQTLSNLGSDEIKIAEEVIRDLGGDPRIGPRFTEQEGKAAEGSLDIIENNISLLQRPLGEDKKLRITPPLVTFFHEIGHWSYFNILTPKDRAEFWELTQKFYGESHGQIQKLRIQDASPRFDKTQATNQAAISPQEFFAQQFELYVTRNRASQILDEKYWQRVLRYVKNIFDRYVKGVPIDNDLEPLFAKILPDGENTKFMTARADLKGNKAGQAYASRYDQLSAIEKSFEEAVAADSADAIINAATELALQLRSLFPRVGYAAKTGTSGALRPLVRHRKVALQRLADIDEILGTRMGIENDVDGDSLRQYYDDGLSAIADPEPIADLLKQVYFHGYSMGWRPLKGMPAQVTEKNIKKSSVKTIVNAIKRALEDKVIQETGGMPSNATPNLDPNATNFSKVNAPRKKATKAQKRSNKAIEAAAENVTKTPATKRSHTNDKNTTTVDPSHAADLKGKDYFELRKLYVKHRGTPRGDQIAFELLVKNRAQSLPAEKVKVTKEIKNAKGDELEAILLKSLGNDNDTAKMAIWEIRRRQTNKGLKAEGKPLIRVSLLRRKLNSETADNIGLAQSDGIPPAARASVREILSYMTHRDPQTQYALRTMTYRMFNLLGKTQREALEDTNILSLDDVAKIAGVEPSSDATSGFADFRHPDFKRMRSDLRRMTIGLTKGKSSPLQVMHEVAHMVVRSGSLERQDMDAIREAYRLSTDNTKKRIQSAYSGKYSDTVLEPLEDKLAEEWFAESLAEYMADRVTKGGVLEGALEKNLGNLRLKGAFSQALDRALEYVAYLINGLVGRNDVKQQFRRLFLYGDMFDNPNRRPMESVLSHHPAVPADHAHAAVVDHIAASPSARLDKIRKFVAKGLSYDEESDTFIEYYHGTPVGFKFDKDADPNVVLEPSTDGQTGRGVYLTTSSYMANGVYAQNPTYKAMARQIDELVSAEQLSPDEGHQAELLAEDLFYVRRSLSEHRNRASTAAQFSPTGEIKASEKQTLDELFEEAVDLTRALEGMGVRFDPMVIPTFVRVQNPIDFRKTSVFKPTDEAAPAQIRAILHHPDMMLFARPDMLAGAIERFSTRQVSGEEAYHNLKRLVQEGNFKGRGQRPQNTLVDIMEDVGIDGIRSTHYNTAPIEGTETNPFTGETYEASATQFDALTVFKASNVKHVNADEFDQNDTRLFYSLDTALPRGMTGSLVMSFGDTKLNSTTAISAGAVGEAAELQGVSAPTTSAIMSMLRGRKFDAKEEQAMRKTSPVAFLQRQSERMQDMGMNWLADWYKNVFPDVHQRFAKQYFPIHHMLRALPDADGKVRSWARRASASAFQSQPDSYKRIVKALRYGNKSRQYSALTDQEKGVWDKIRTTLNNERRAMIRMGMRIGNRENYLPQVWDAKSIRKNKDDFVQKMARYFEYERADRGLVDDQARDPADLAENMYLRLTEEGEGGAFIPMQGGSREPQMDAALSRIIELEKYPAMMKELEDYLEGDLEALLIKYFEGSSRKMAHADKLGVRDHAFYDYMVASTGGKAGIVKLLSTNKEFMFERRALSDSGFVESIALRETIPMPFAGREDLANDFVDKLITEANGGGGRAAIIKMLEDVAPKINGKISVTFKKRADAIAGALTDYKGNKPSTSPKDMDFLENAMRVAQKKPMHGNQSGMTFSKTMRSFNNVSLLSFTTLTSLGDVALPIIRSGSFTDWSKGLANWTKDKHYKQFIHDTGVAMENIVHERMVHMYGAVDNKLSNAFFNITMLTPWTDLNRQIGGATGFEALKTMQRRARDYYKEGADMSGQPVQYKTAVRFLKNYGLGDFAYPQGAHKDVDIGAAVGGELSDEQDRLVRMGIIKFADDCIFQPNPNDNPLWAQTPWGALVAQLKSFPLMMSRLTGHVFKEAAKGNVKPLMYFATLGPAFGMGALSIKDIVQHRGGEDERSPDLRDRNILKTLGYDEKIHGDENDFLGWYAEGMIAMGGFGLMLDVMHSAVTQADNGSYGQVRFAETLLGPTFGDVMAGMQIAGGIMDGSESNSKERTAARAAVGRIPLVGGIRAAKEGIVDTIAGEPRKVSGSGGNSWQASWEGGWN